MAFGVPENVTVVVLVAAARQFYIPQRFEQIEFRIDRESA